MNQESRYSLTRVCLRRGELSLPRSLEALVQDAETITAVDTLNNNELSLSVRPPRVLAGLAPYFKEHGLDVNDSVLLRVTGPGKLEMTAQVREKRPATLSAGEIVDAVIQAGPVTEAEARALLPGLAADYPLRDVLQRDGRLVLKGGRWRQPEAEDLDREIDSVLTGGADAPAAESDAAFYVRSVLQAVGFAVTDMGGSSYLLDSEGPRRSGGYTVLAHVASGEERLDWAQLLELRRTAQAEMLAVFAEDRVLAGLVAPAGLAQATLWSLVKLDEVVTAAQSLPLSTYDLESHFRRDGLYGPGLERFGRSVAARITEQGAFSQVMTSLAALGGPGRFTLEDVTGTLPRELARTILDQLSHAPFQLVVESEGGQYHLRADVRTGLSQMAEYARSLQGHMPRQPVRS